MKVKCPEAVVDLRAPRSHDGAALHGLVASCPPLDQNSMYCNLLQCTHFSETSVVVDGREGLLGAITGYLPPGRPDTLFVWQVAVREEARGQGLATRMLRDILQRPACAGVAYLETTVTPGNSASWALFEGFARSVGVPLRRDELFTRHEHFDDQHDTEILVQVGPLSHRALGGSENQRQQRIVS